MTKYCDHHANRRRKILRRLCACLLVTGLIILVLVLIIWAILQPTKPRFILQDATVFAFNLSSPHFLTSNIQVTISSRNPNDNIGIYYDHLDVYSTYRGQQISLRYKLPPTYQGHKDVIVWSPILSGTNIPISESNGLLLSQEQAYGAVKLVIKIDGRVRWKVGTFITGRYHLYVNCPAYIPFGNPNTGIVIGDAVKYQLSRRCTVSV